MKHILIAILAAATCGMIPAVVGYIISKCQNRQPDMRGWSVEQISAYVSKRYAKAFKWLSKH